MALDETKQLLTTTQISELISKRSKGEIYKISVTLRDSLSSDLNVKVMLKVLTRRTRVYIQLHQRVENCYRVGLLFCRLIIHNTHPPELITIQEPD
jgi:hypothetical protein